MRKLIGSKAYLFFDTFDPAAVIIGDDTITTQPLTKYFVVSRGTGSNLPIGEGGIFQSPKSGSTQITLKTGDRVQALNPQRFCKTSADISVQQGVVDVGDDCDVGASVLDGVVKASGSFAGFIQEDMETGEFTDITMEILNRFFDIIHDDGAGIYTYTARNDDPMYIMLNINSGVKVGQTEKWLFMPIVLPSFSTSFGMTEAESMNISWNQGEGKPTLYEVVKVA
jgi:hypothetical protein